MMILTKLTSVVTGDRVISTHTELIINGRPDTLWWVFVVAGGLCKNGAPNIRSPPSPSLPGGSPGSRPVETVCPFSDSVLIADVGDRRASQGDRIDDRNEGWRNVGGGEAGPAVVAASRASRADITDRGQA